MVSGRSSLRVKKECALCPGRKRYTPICRKLGPEPDQEEWMKKLAHASRGKVRHEKKMRRHPTPQK